MVGCIFNDSWWNDPEQRNYTLHKCSNLKNIGGESKLMFHEDHHGERTYSCHHKNEGMAYRCWGRPDKIKNCPMALTKSFPEVDCRIFVKEDIHPKEALISRERLREEFYRADAVCVSCGNCLYKK